MIKRRSPLTGSLWAILLRLLIAALFLVPFYLILRNALMTDTQITSRHWAWLPGRPHWENFRQARSQ